MMSKNRTLTAKPLTRKGFAPFGDVIETTAATKNPMNDGRFERYESLATVDIATPDNAKIDIVRCLQPTALPYRLEVMERHPLGSQAFIPLTAFVFVVVVAPAAAELDPDAIQAFVSNGRQGINYHRGTWHMPMIATEAGQSFLVIDRAGAGSNCDMVQLAEPLMLLPDPVQT